VQCWLTIGRQSQTWAISQQYRRVIMTEELGFWSEEHLASLSQSQDSEGDWMMIVVTCASNFLNLLQEHAPAGWSGRMCPESFHPGAVKREVKVTMEDGKEQSEVISHASLKGFRNAGMGGPTGCLTLNMCEWTGLNGLSLNDEGVCSLSDILETGALPQRYYLSAKACLGILRRAERRGKELPAQLRAALESVATQTPATKTMGG